ncbi:RNA polymerase II transcription factor-like protein B subunit 3 [Mollisia scopiformis]|uniref:RNA polymerase II transcription factor B subunit 3 n=1 Tax=Mollisia scopiformis TaxID=149040 RepID=A0A132BAW1_MOLSC|nr:RNA polymerase II transcription factor-like protein B subunit 3 [Mollisia scopiformis]KUJ09526.1 RNA polymerase II transcription factor-like protein B subunit 3 [Mollisia scopiformis]
MIRNGASKSLESNPSDDICPVCKSNRYLTPSLQFLINPECYHKMCSTCVDRIFTSGPASCPVRYCGKTLRKKGFHKAFFGDLKVERECDIRKRVGAVYNKRQDEFETLLDWNNYLENVEGLVFDLVEGGKEDKMRAEEKLRAYKERNLGEIEANKRAGLEEIEMEKRRERAEKEAARQRRLAAVREAEEEKMDVEKSRREVLEKLASGEGDAREITEMAQKVVLKKSGARRIASEAILQSNGSAKDPNLTIRGLKKREAPVAEKPYEPFGGVDLAPSRYVLQEDYDSEWLANAKKDQRHAAGGFSLHEYYARTMFEAFSGLGVFIEDEMGSKALPAVPSSIGTEAAAEASTGKIKVEHKMELDDVF